jgi:hypothetical protein
MRAALPSELRQLRAEATMWEAHKRIPENAANLFLGLRYFFEFAAACKAITAAERSQYEERAWTELLEAAKAQRAHQTASEPTQHFFDLLEGAIASGRAHLASAKGEVPTNAKVWGWRLRNPEWDDSWIPQGDRIGWLEDEFVYLQPEAAFATAQRFGRDTGEPLSIYGGRRSVLHLSATAFTNAKPAQPAHPRIEKKPRLPVLPPGLADEDMEE